MKAALGLQMAEALGESCGLAAQVGAGGAGGRGSGARWRRWGAVVWFGAGAGCCLAQVGLGGSCVCAASHCHARSLTATLTAAHIRPAAPPRMQCSEDAVDVLADGFAFRLLLHSGRDAAMVGTTAPPPTPTAAAPTAAAPAPAGAGGAEAVPLARARHHGLVAAACAAHPALAPTVRLLARWLGAHLAGSHFAHEAVELLVVAAFTRRGAEPAPGSRLTGAAARVWHTCVVCVCVPTLRPPPCHPSRSPRPTRAPQPPPPRALRAGFLRALRLLARHPWGAAPLVVDPERTLTPAQHAQLVAGFEARGRGGRPAMFLATPWDLESSQWWVEG